ncbi:MAG: PAS domain S-box protein [Cyclobacteriaceae bacterium]|nr:PAS domain S-box protein [Cyclobacteriaceae bacterium]
MQSESINTNQLLSGEGRYQELIESLPTAIYTCDADGYILQFNQAAVDLWGIAPIAGKTRWCGSWKIFNTDGTLLTPDKYPTAVVIRDGMSVTGQEIIIERPDGVRLNVLPHPRPIKNSSGVVIGAVNMLVDITVRKATEEKLRLSEQRLRLATEGTRLATWDLNLQTREIIYSPRLATLFGHEETKVITHQQMRDQIHRDDIHTIVEKAFEKALQTNDYNYEARVVHPDQSIRWIKTNGKVLYDDNKVPVRMLGTMLDITDSRAAEERTERLAAIVDSADDAIVGITMEGIVTSWNGGAVRLYGYTAEEMIGRSMSHIIPLNRQQEEVDILSRIKKGENVDHFETIRVAKGNTEIEISLTVSPIKDLMGNTVGASKSARNITQQKLDERRIAENELKLQIVIQASDLGTWELNVKTGAVSYSKRYLEIIGYPDREHLTHADLLRRLHPEDKVIRDNAFQDAYAKGHLEYVSRLIWEDGTIRWIEAKGKVFYDEQGKPEKLIGTVRDISEEKFFQQELLENEKRFRLLADSMPQFVWTGDPKGNLNYFNQSVYDYSGLTVEKVQQEGWLQIVHPDERDENVRVWIESIQSGNDFLFEHRFKRKDGEYRWQLSRAIAQRDNEGNIQMWVGTSTDIHDRKLFISELESKVQERTRELNQRNEDLVKSNIELGQFAYVASHDLQEPLRKIQTFATRIQELEADHLTDSGKDYLKRMQSASTRMKQLIVDLLTYSRASTAERNFELINLTTILNTVLEQLKESIDQKQATIQFATLPMAHVIPYQFEQLLTNIISNALKFSKQGVIPVILITTTKVEGDTIRHWGATERYYHLITIKDNGIGFDPQFSDRIFQVFQRLHGKDEYAGTGIGLSIVKKIVENHNGFITTESGVDEGAAFKIYLPVG